MRNYKLNSEMPWHPFIVDISEPEENREVFLLVEEDTCDPDLYPWVCKAVKIKKDFIHISSPYMYRFKLCDVDLEEQEEFLSLNYFNIISWRYMTEK
jgi:hypothetical protein